MPRRISFAASLLFISFNTLPLFPISLGLISFFVQRYHSRTLKVECFVIPTLECNQLPLTLSLSHSQSLDIWFLVQRKVSAFSLDGVSRTRFVWRDFSSGCPPPKPLSMPSNAVGKARGQADQAGDTLSGKTGRRTKEGNRPGATLPRSSLFILKCYSSRARTLQTRTCRGIDEQKGVTNAPKYRDSGRSLFTIRRDISARVCESKPAHTSFVDWFGTRVPTFNHVHVCGFVAAPTFGPKDKSDGASHRGDGDCPAVSTVSPTQRYRLSIRRSRATTRASLVGLVSLHLFNRAISTHGTREFNRSPLCTPAVFLSRYFSNLTQSLASRYSRNILLESWPVKTTKKSR